MAETTSLQELSAAAWTGTVTVHEGQPCDHSDDGGGGFTLCFGDLRRTGSGPVIHRFGYAEDIREDQYPVAFAEAKANIGLLARLWNDYRAGRLIDPTTLTEAVAAARAEGVREGLERAARSAAALAEHYYGEPCDETWSNRDRHMQLGRTHAAAVAANGIRSLISALPATPPTTPGGRTDG